MSQKEQLDCKDCQKELQDCKFSKCKQCEEDKIAAFAIIKKYEKKIFTLTIIIAIVATLLGKDFIEKVIDSFSTFEKVEQKVELQTEPLKIEKEETRGISSNDISSYWFS